MRGLRLTGLVAFAALALPASSTTVFHAVDKGVASQASPLADAANAAFLAGLTDVRIAGFENFAAGAKPSTLSFEGASDSTAAAFSGAGAVVTAHSRAMPSSIDTFAAEGNAFYSLNGSSFSITFDQAIGGLGFYAVDVETNALASITLASGLVETYSFSTLFNSGKAGSGSAAFLGFTSLEGITGLTLTHSGIDDGYAFDNFQIGTLSPAVSEVPEPATWAMFACAFGLLGGALRRRERVVLRAGL